MAQTTQIDVGACDNEFYLVASTPAGSSELLHIKSGYNKPVSHTIYPPAILPPGNYTLTMIGINWGGPSAFKVKVTAGTATNYASTPSSSIGVVWNQSIPMTI
jgi:hypothetical protein